MPTKTQYNQLINDLKDAFQRNGFDPISWKVQGQKEEEEKILQKKSNLYIKTFDADTHGTIEAYHEFVEKKDLKLLWARVNCRSYKLDPIELYNICPDRCPIMGVLLDYGMGKNRVATNPYFFPGQDHITAVFNGGTKYGDINNIQILTQFINTIKNQGTTIDALKWLFFDLQNK